MGIEASHGRPTTRTRSNIWEGLGKVGSEVPEVPRCEFIQ